MTHQQMIDFWEKEIQKHERAQRILSTSLQISWHKELEIQARTIYAQLITMETKEPITTTGTKFGTLDAVSSVHLDPECHKIVSDNFWQLLGDEEDNHAKVKSKCRQPELVPCGKHRPFGLCADDENNGCHLQVRQRKAEIGLEFKYEGHNAVIADIYENMLMLAMYENTETNTKEYVAAAGFTGKDGRLIVHPNKFKLTNL